MSVAVAVCGVGVCWCAPQSFRMFIFHFVQSLSSRVFGCRTDYFLFSLRPPPSQHLGRISLSCGWVYSAQRQHRLTVQFSSAIPVINGLDALSYPPFGLPRFDNHNNRSPTTKITYRAQSFTHSLLHGYEAKAHGTSPVSQPASQPHAHTAPKQHRHTDTLTSNMNRVMLKSCRLTAYTE